MQSRRAEVRSKVLHMKEEELKKKITTWLKEGSPLIVLDNISGRIEYPLHSPGYKLPIPGVIDSLVEIQRAGIMTIRHGVTTGNNIMLGGDLPRRCYSITLESVWAQTMAGETEIQAR